MSGHEVCTTLEVSLCGDQGLHRLHCTVWHTVSYILHSRQFSHQGDLALNCLKPTLQTWKLRMTSSMLVTEQTRRVSECW